MNIWRPSSQIRVKSLGLHWRDGKLLAAKVYNDAGQLKGVRPLGGSVEFGETVHAALIREFKEELDVEVKAKGAPVFMENIYHHEGATGHEIIFLFEVEFLSTAYDDRDEIEFYENDGSRCTANWYDLNALDLENGPELYPAGLKTLLTSEHGAHRSGRT